MHGDDYDDEVFVALEGYLLCPEKLAGGLGRNRVEKIEHQAKYFTGLHT